MSVASLGILRDGYMVEKSLLQEQGIECSKELKVAVSESTKDSEYYNQKIIDLNNSASADNPVYYQQQRDKIDKEYKDKQAENAAVEEEINQKKSNIEAEITLIDEYIDVLDTAIQKAAKSEFSYGPNQ